MDEITSSEFRRTYASLTEPTRVTVNGHPIGTWMPVKIVDRRIRERIEDAADEVALAEEGMRIAAPVTDD